MKQKEDIPIVYAYIYRNLLNCEARNISHTQLVHCLRKVIYKATYIVYNQILEEMESFQLIKRVNHQRYIVLSNSKAKAKLNKLKDYAFW